MAKVRYTYIIVKKSVIFFKNYIESQNTLIVGVKCFLGGLFGNCLTTISGLSVTSVFLFTSSRYKVSLDLNPFLKKLIFCGFFHFLGGNKSLKAGLILSGSLVNKLSLLDAWKLSIFNIAPGWNSKFWDFSANSVWNAES